MKKIFIAITCLVVIAAAGIFYYNSTQSELEITIGAPVDKDTDSYSESLVISLGTKNYSDEIYAQTTEIVERFNQNRIDTIPSLGKPYHIEVEVSFQDGQTIISNIGTYTDEEGATQNYRDDLVFDFIVTQNVTYPE